MGHDELAATRRSLHGVAELVLAGPQYRATGRLRLCVVPGGFATTLTPRLRVDGSLVTDADGVAAAIAGRTPRAIGAELGVVAGRPEGVYHDGSGVDPDETLDLDPIQAGVIAAATLATYANPIGVENCCRDWLSSDRRVWVGRRLAILISIHSMAAGDVALTRMAAPCRRRNRVVAASQAS